ncbi:MAG: hypothetical protein WB762_08510 [Candidatus Sulfotelmatobacter sp.]
MVESLSQNEIPNAILFERRGERVGYRLTGALTDATTLDPSVLNGNVDSLYGDLEETLVGQGLYRDEAQAMVETWKDSWFEEGSPLIYIVRAGSSTRSCLSESIQCRGRSSASLSAGLKS